jgi:hypothetical protein
MSSKVILIFKSVLGGATAQVFCGTTGGICNFVIIIRADMNRSTIHNATWDYNGKQPRHGTLVYSFAEIPYFDPAALTRREALGLLDDSEREQAV